jgi:type II secretory pathway component PulC
MLNSKSLTLVLIAVCTILANIIFFTLTSSQELELSQPPKNENTPQANRPRSSPAGSLADIDYYEEITKRPLFNSDRTPEEVHVEEQTIETSTAGRRPDLTLIGIVLTDDEQLALVRSRKSPKIQRVKLDESLEGWKLAELKPNTAVFRSGTRDLTLELNRRGDPKKARQLKKKQANNNQQNLINNPGNNPRNNPKLNNLPPGVPPIDDDVEMDMELDDEEFEEAD